MQDWRFSGCWKGTQAWFVFKPRPQFLLTCEKDKGAYRMAW